MDDFIFLPYLFSVTLLGITLLDTLEIQYNKIKIKFLESALFEINAQKHTHPMMEFCYKEFDSIEIEFYQMVLFYLGYENFAYDTLIAQNLKKLTVAQFKNLTHPFVEYLFKNKQLTLQQILNLSSHQHKILSCTFIQELIRRKKLPLLMALNLNRTQFMCIKLTNIFKLINRNILPIRTVLQLDTEQFLLLNDDDVTELLIAEIFTVDEILNLNLNQQYIITRTNFRMLLMLGLFTVEDLYLIAPPNHMTADELNHPQNTHTASVHQSTALSAKRLLEQYPFTNESITLEHIKISFQVHPGIERHDVALRCLERLTHAQNRFIERQSNISVTQLLALSYLSLCHHLKLPTEILQHLSQTLYEIQRGYNLSDTQTDDQKADKPICLAGAFNKLIERLQGLEPLCEIIHLTPAVASIKFKAIVENQSQHFLQHAFSLKTAANCILFCHMLLELQQQGIQQIWPLIEFRCAELLYQEFSSLFKSQQNTQFKAIVNAGAELNYQFLYKFQKKICLATGYKAYLSALLSQNHGLFDDVNSQNSTLLNYKNC